MPHSRRLLLLLLLLVNGTPPGQEGRVGGSGMGRAPPTPPQHQSGLRALWENQGLEDIREGDDALHHVALIHHHQTVHLGGEGGGTQHGEGAEVGTGTPLTP